MLCTGISQELGSVSAPGAQGCFSLVCTCTAQRKTKQCLPRGSSVPCEVLLHPSAPDSAPKGFPRHLAGRREGYLPPRMGQAGEWEIDEPLGEKVSQKPDNQSL